MFVAIQSSKCEEDGISRRYGRIHLYGNLSGQKIMVKHSI